MISYIPLTKGRVTIVDTEDYEVLTQYQWGWHCGYARRREKNKTIHMHRLLVGCPHGFEVDHINRNKLDNRKSNLRIVTRQQNMCNKARYKGSSSKYKGVSWHSKDKLWHAQIRVDKQLQYLGAYEQEEVAAAAYNYYAKKFFKQYAVLNDIEEIDFFKVRVLKRKGSSKYRGVTYRRQQSTWVARITVDGNRKTLGYFDTEEDAARAYNEAFVKYRNKVGVPNFI